MARNYNYIINQGADWFLSIEYLDPAGVPIDLTGYTAAMQFRPVASDITELNLTSGSGITIVPLTGTIDIHITAVQTADLQAAQYDYQLEITSGTDIVTRLIQGLASVDGQLTP